MDVTGAMDVTVVGVSPAERFHLLREFTGFELEAR
jgi:hypothetical protein